MHEITMRFELRNIFNMVPKCAGPQRLESQVGLCKSKCGEKIFWTEMSVRVRIPFLALLICGDLAKLVAAPLNKNSQEIEEIIGFSILFKNFGDKYYVRERNSQTTKYKNKNGTIL